MLKTTNLTKTLFSHQTHSQPIQLCTPSTTSSSGSVCETDLPSSTGSSYRSHLLTNGVHSSPVDSQPDESNVVLIQLIDKLKRELATIKHAKCQLETLYKVRESPFLACHII